MKYMLLNYPDDPALSGAQRQVCYLKWTELPHWRNLIDGYPTIKDSPTTKITSISARNGKGLVTDGPFAETYELLGG